jgi:HSP20 family protein
MTLITKRNFPATAEMTPFQVFEDALSRMFAEGPAARPWSPAVDIVETEDDLLLTADIPGVPMENIDIRIENGTLTLSGERKFESSQEDKKAGWHRIERSYGSFARSFTLPDSIDADQVSASHENGVLSVKLPKKEVAKPRSIKVAVSNIQK